MFCLYGLVDLSPVWGRETSWLLAPTKGPNACVLEVGRKNDFSERYATEEHFFANSR